VPLMGGDVGAEGVEGAFDSVDGVHVPPVEEFLV
jgi:hypothetical protein